MSAIALSCNEFHGRDLIRACRILGASPLLSNEMVKSRDLLKSEHIRWASGSPLGCGSRRLNRAPPAAVARIRQRAVPLDHTRLQLWRCHSG
jgi:hypothetical protein